MSPLPNCLSKISPLWGPLPRGFSGSPLLCLFSIFALLYFVYCTLTNKWLIDWLINGSKIHWVIILKLTKHEFTQKISSESVHNCSTKQRTNQPTNKQTEAISLSSDFLGHQIIRFPSPWDVKFIKKLIIKLRGPNQYDCQASTCPVLQSNKTTLSADNSSSALVNYPLACYGLQTAENKSDKWQCKDIC